MTTHVPAYDDYGAQGFELAFVPTYVEPPLVLLPQVRDLPADFRKPLMECFRLFWSSAPAAAGRIRVMLERFMDQEQVLTSKVSLQARIKHWGASDPANAAVATELEALKWLGNDGSHRDDLTREMILDALMVVDSVLDQISGHRDHVAEVVASAISNKGSKKRRP